MLARVTTIHIQPGQTEEVTQFVRDSVLPAAQQQHGFRDLLILVDPANHQGIAITMWETEADMAAGEARDGYHTQQLARAAQYFSAQPVREVFEVDIQYRQKGRTARQARVLKADSQSPLSQAPSPLFASRLFRAHQAAPCR